jgi:uncharacterized protein (DUF2062 family)
MSVAVGLAIAFVPLYGSHSFLVLGVCWALRLDAPLAFASTLISNPITLPFLLALELEVGGALIGHTPIDATELLAGNGWTDVATQLAVGASISAVVVASLGAVLAFNFVRRLRAATPGDGAAL